MTTSLRIGVVVLAWLALGSLPAAAQNVSLTINLAGPNNGTVGVIPSVTKPFCGDCDRVRLTADGSLRSR